MQAMVLDRCVDERFVMLRLWTGEKVRAFRGFLPKGVKSGDEVDVLVKMVPTVMNSRQENSPAAPRG
jgi:hypothetical protein